jgi:Tol biopolymer transport system component
MDSDGSDPTPLVETYFGDECEWSPDGTKIAFYFSPSHEVYLVNVDGSGRVALRGNKALDGQPDWSPDGKKIAFASDRDGDLDIYTMDADGSDVAQVTNLPGDEQFPDWQPLTPKSRTDTVHPPDTGGLPLLLVATPYFSPGGSCSMRVLDAGCSPQHMS